MRRLLWSSSPTEKVTDGSGAAAAAAVAAPAPAAAAAPNAQAKGTDRKIAGPLAATETDRPPAPRLTNPATISTKTPTLVNSSMKNAKRKKKRSSSEMEHDIDLEGPSKRNKTATPVAVSEHEQSSSDEAEAKAKAEGCYLPTSTEHRLATDDPQYRSDLLRCIPPEVVGLCLSYLCSTSDRHSLQTTCRLFWGLSNAPDTMLSKLALGGHTETGRGGLIVDSDDPNSAVVKLRKFARIGNLDAIYM
jgi:hypothetical protein